MTLSRKDLLSYLILMVTGFISISIICLTHSPIVHILVMWAVCVVAMHIVNFDLMHPFFWFSVIFTLYSTAYAILYVMGVRNYGYTYQNILFPLIALLVVIFVVGPGRIKHSEQIIKDLTIDTVNAKYVSYLVYTLSLLLTLSTIALLSRGYNGKKEMQAANDLFYRFGVYFCRFLTFFVLLRLHQIRLYKKKNYSMLILSAISIVLFGLCTGERDTYLRFFMVILFFLYSINQIKKKHFILLVPICIAVLVSSVGFKYYLTQGVEVKYFTENLLETFLNADFYAAGQNLQYLLDRQWTKGYWGIETFFSEVFNPLIPSELKVNLDYWFNYEVHINGWHGYAFTLVGTGYVISGLLGIIITFVLVGLFIKYLYRYSNKSALMHTIYLYGMTIVMISCRGTLSSYSNSLLKEIIVSCIVIYVIDQISSRHSRV